MNKQEYLEQEIVKEFIDWLIPRIYGKVEFNHDYINSRDKSLWKCNSIFNAFENYKWRFNCVIPNKGKISGNTFIESKNTLEIIEKGMKYSIQENNHKNLLEYSSSILEWGGVKRSNYDKLKDMEESITDYYKDSIKRLNPETVDTKDDFSGINMNSGFTKIYSLLINNFVIYDSRVGAALGLLVKSFLTEKNIVRIPDELNFAYGNARPTKNDKGPLNRRNPSNEKYKFPVLTNNDKKHIKNNIYANWLLKEISDNSKFQNESSPIRALESALFMIGYSVN
jgi:hypothetical protein